ncbi:SusC/RagA family TonB-linked outer membrane protein [Emticicia sp. CRIBPO]|uniref:SusC/RagA family TonB-linked outer membrane protein n=1 Tax=Emticicia sp. CRIBPO TaxID=2683258 RepID=UPI00141300A5|nr:TonB-dependent receptor [Emticicia sp. CRIBPO]NBA85447.1 SusC/RagA family TonB-linked outer membrane protein [Emticicia sp. CRIBPO]
MQKTITNFPGFFRRSFLTIGLVASLMMSAGVAFAQRTVKGKVSDSVDGSGMPGVTVQVKGELTGTQTDINGEYQIMAKETATLVFSFIGKISQEIVVGNQSVINVTLADNAQTLGEVVVIGYGSQKKKDLTGSIVSVSSEDFVKGQITTPEQLVSGKLAGVQITSNGGAPGSGSTIRIRGGSSLTANNDPLIVLDGVPLDKNKIEGSPNALSLINPNDIETFTVLKDASATAIYGSRASNGVIIITTKKGTKSGKMSVNFSTLLSTSIRTKNIETLSADQFREMITTRGSEAQQALLGTENTVWADQIYKTAITSDNNLSISGSVKKMPYRVSLGYLNQNGILKTSNLGRTSASVALSPMFLDNHLKVDVNLKGSITNNRFADQGAIGAAVFFDPTQPVYSKTDRFSGYFEWLDPATGKPNTLAPRNPLALLESRNNSSDVQRSIGNIVFDYKFHFLPDLRANLNLGYDVSKSDGINYVSDSASIAYNRNGQDLVYTQNKNNKTLEFYLNYVKDLPSIGSRIDIMGGYSYQDFLRENTNLDKNLNGEVFTDFRYKTQNTLVSFYGRANYALLDKYLLTFTLRRDGSSRFSPDNRWGLFPSAALAWKISEEGFLKNSAVLSDLKLRLGYGVTGQQDIGVDNPNDYPYLARYTLSQSTAQYQFGNTFIQTLRPEGYDANIKWEETRTYNAGIDFALKTARISGSLDYYMRETKDLLSVIPVPAGSNLTNQILTNVGNIENSGVEFALNTSPVIRPKFSWDLGFNITYNKNTITNLTKVADPTFPGVLTGGISGGVGNTVQIHTVGYPTNTYFVYNQVYDAAGKPIEGVYEEMNGDGVITPDDRVRMKDPQADVFLGFTSQFTFGKFTAGFVSRANFGNYNYNNVNSQAGVFRPNSTPYLTNVTTDALKSGFTNSQYFSNYYLQNASFFRIDNINFGYSLGKIFNKKADATLSGNIQNALVITKYKGLDPEISGGIDNNFYPRPRVFTLGLNIGF